MELPKFTDFDWDAGNETKNRDKHGVEQIEAEQIFFNTPLLISEDSKHSSDESRYYALGITDKGRLLLIVFTKRSDKIRVISARDMSRKERRNYEKYSKI